MRLSRKVSYALQATLELAELRSESPVPCSQLAAEGRMPARFLLQVLRSLVAHGILRSCRGVDGGYALTRPPEKISLLELIEAIDGPLVPSFSAGDCLLAKSRGKLERALREVTEGARDDLRAIKLADLLPESLPTAGGQRLGSSQVASCD